MPSRGALDEMRDVLVAVQPDFSVADSAVPLVLPDVTEGWLERAECALRSASSRYSRTLARSSRGAKRRRGSPPPCCGDDAV